MNPQNLVALLTLTILELVLGVDNIIFLAVVTAGLPAERQRFARRLGLTLALLGRIVMVFGISYLMMLDTELFTLFGHSFTAEETILLVGGVFLVYKAVTEIYKETEFKEEGQEERKPRTDSMSSVITQIVFVDMIFAIDSVLTAVGLTQVVWVIVVAMTIAILVMMFFAEGLSKFIQDHPSLKMLALSFLVLVGTLLIADGLGQHLNRTVVYFAILFSLGVEALNFRREKNLKRQLERQGPSGV